MGRLAFVAVLALLATAGCRQIFGIEPVGGGGGGGVDGGGPGDGPSADIATDSSDGSSAALCFASGTSFEVCVSSLPTNDVTLAPNGTVSIDTDASSLCSALAHWTSSTQPNACFVVGRNVSIGAGTLTATGGRPLVLVASETASVDAPIDVASHGTASGAAAGVDPPGGPACEIGLVAASGGGGGGAGGSFATRGGNGGLGLANGQGGTAGATIATTSVLRGGCNAQLGASGGGSAISGTGGGALFVVAGATIQLSSWIDASGSGGSPGGSGSGGTGGGSGGTIVLDAPQIQIAATGVYVIAQGGGGACGGIGANCAGSDPVAGGASGAGGTSSSGGGVGGNGDASTSATQAPAMNGTPGGAGGGGGGGGGAGAILANRALTAATVVSPPAIPL